MRYLSNMGCTRDLKSFGGNAVRVQVPSRVQWQTLIRMVLVILLGSCTPPFVSENKDCDSSAYTFSHREVRDDSTLRDSVFYCSNNLAWKKIVSYYSNGARSVEAYFFMTKKAGTWTTFQKNGLKMSTCNYCDDHLCGESLYYSPDDESKVIRREVYGNEGDLVSSQEY